MSLRDLFTTPPPDVAVEIDHTHVAAARIAVRGSQTRDRGARVGGPAAGCGGAGPGRAQHA